MRRLVLLLVAVVMAFPTPGALAQAPVADRRAPGWAPYVGATDLIEFTVTARSRVTFVISAGWPSTWSAGPENRTYDVQVRRASMLAAKPPAWRSRWTGSTVERRRMGIRGGQALCVRVRQHSYGQTSAWSSPACVVRGRDDSRVRRAGPMHVERATAYPDRRATSLDPGATLRLRGVPKGARYGVVFTDVDDGRSDPMFRLAGVSQSMSWSGGYGAHGLHWQVRPAPRGGTLQVDAEWGTTLPVGALIVIPRWVQ